MTILLDKFSIPEEKHNNLDQGISKGTANVISYRSFNQTSLIRPARTSAIILANNNSDKLQCVEGENWITEKKPSISI